MSPSHYLFFLYLIWHNRVVLWDEQACLTQRTAYLPTDHQERSGTSDWLRLFIHSWWRKVLTSLFFAFWSIFFYQQNIARDCKGCSLSFSACFVTTINVMISVSQCVKSCHECHKNYCSLYYLNILRKWFGPNVFAFVFHSFNIVLLSIESNYQGSINQRVLLSS